MNVNKKTDFFFYFFPRERRVLRSVGRSEPLALSVSLLHFLRFSVLTFLMFYSSLFLTAENFLRIQGRYRSLEYIQAPAILFASILNSGQWASLLVIIPSPNEIKAEADKQNHTGTL